MEIFFKPTFGTHCSPNKKGNHFLSYFRKSSNFTFKIITFSPFLDCLIQHLNFLNSAFECSEFFFRWSSQPRTDTRATLASHIVQLQWDEDGRISKNRYALRSKADQAFNMWPTQSSIPLEIPQTQNGSI